MSKTVESFIAEPIQEYQRVTNKTCTEMALDFDVTLSNLGQEKEIHAREPLTRSSPPSKRTVLNC